jgi:methylmalonyl-CoA mutase C-terminal domain/subunit
MEVVYTGLHRSPVEVARIAADEDVDAIGVSVLSGAHMTIFPRLLAHLEEEGVGGVVVLAGGTILPDDAAELERLGVARVFGVDTPLGEIVDFLRAAVAERRGART